MAEANGNRWFMVVAFLVSFGTSVAVTTGAYWKEVSERREGDMLVRSDLSKIEGILSRMDATIATLRDYVDRITARDRDGFVNPDFSGALDKQILSTGRRYFEDIEGARTFRRELKRTNPTLAVPD